MSLPPTISLHGKAAIVTGASRGLSKDIALELASREAVAEDVRKHGVDACIVRANIAGPDCGKEMIEGALRGLKVEKIDILVNNAAMGQKPKPTAEFTIEEYQRIMDTNVRGPLLLVQALIPHLAAEGARIINISSVSTKHPVSELVMYAISKAALESLTRQWAVELAKNHHLTVNAINCGPLDKEPTIPATELVVKARAKIMSVTSAANRIGICDDIAQIVAFLASEGSRWINGQVVCGNGGVTFF